MYASMPEWVEEIEDNEDEVVASNPCWISAEDHGLGELELAIVSASMATADVVEGGFFSSIILAPFKAMFWGVTFVLKVVGVIALVIGAAVFSPILIAGFGAFIWFLTNKIRNKFRNARAAMSSDPEKFEQAKDFAPRVADSLRNPKVQAAMRDDPKAAEAIYSALDALGQRHVTASCMAVVAAMEISEQTSNEVSAAWQAKMNSPAVNAAALIVSTILGAMSIPVGVVVGITWFIVGLHSRKWNNAKEAERLDKAKVKEAKVAAKAIKSKMEDPKVQRMLKKNPESAALITKALKELGA